ncbi:MAG: shikimate kinase [Actinobacteria bacterium]|nr:shikimate kinase [Actinomycetota bacterium]
MGSHVFLIGMPGSGKSSVGRVLARRLRRPFVDLDRAVEEAAGRSIAEVFAEGGEEGFRDRESAALRAAAAGPASVVACGGGAVLRPGNRGLMAASGTVVHLAAPVEVLAARIRPHAGRPLVRSDRDLAALLAARAPTYRAAAHVEVDATGEPEDVAAAVLAALGEPVA